MFLLLEWLSLQYINVENLIFLIHHHYTTVSHIGYSVGIGWSLIWWPCQTTSCKYPIHQQLKTCTVDRQYYTLTSIYADNLIGIKHLIIYPGILTCIYFELSSYRSKFTFLVFVRTARVSSNFQWTRVGKMCILILIILWCLVTD